MLIARRNNSVKGGVVIVSIVKGIIKANGIDIRVSSTNESDYISLTDIAKKRDSENPRFIIQNWMRSRSTISFLGLWEELNNPSFNRVEFEAFKNESGDNAFVLTPQKWISATNAIGIISKSGRYGGTFAHSDIAFEFASWISPEFKLYIIKDYQRLKADESHANALDWSVKREIAKSNYRLHTDAIKEAMAPNLTPQQISYTYASEADMINAALFGVTAGQWRAENPKAKGNIRDYASIEQLIVLANLECLNAEYIQEGLTQKDRLIRLNKAAAFQLKALSQNLKSIQSLKQMNN